MDYLLVHTQMATITQSETDQGEEPRTATLSPTQMTTGAKLDFFHCYHRHTADTGAEVEQLGLEQALPLWLTDMRLHSVGPWSLAFCPIVLALGSYTSDT